MSCNTAHLCYVEAYARKAELGGGFRAAGINKLTGERMNDSTVYDSLQKAKAACGKFVWSQANGRNMVTGTFRNRSGKTWRMNYFIRSDEV